MSKPATFNGDLDVDVAKWLHSLKLYLDGKDRNELEKGFCKADKPLSQGDPKPLFT